MQIIFAIGLSVLVLELPESPRRLLNNVRDEQATESSIVYDKVTTVETLGKRVR